MSRKYNVLSCDIGASSGRMVLIGLEDNKLLFDVVHKFKNGPICINESIFWDIVNIYGEIKKGLVEAKNHDVVIDSFGIDTWGNDFALIDKKGNMMENPFCYRDARTENMIEYVSGIIDSNALYMRNGVQLARFNTLYQLASLAKDRPYVFDNANKLLFIPDLLCYFLTGKVVNEYTLSTISEMYSYAKGDWDFELLAKLKIPGRIFSKPVMPCMSIGYISQSVCHELNIRSISITAVPAHDTASAVVSVPHENEQVAYISSGTWSILGTEVFSPIINVKGLKYNFSNEGGIQNRIRLSKNIMGLWIIQEIQRSFETAGKKYSYAEMECMARRSDKFIAYVGPDDKIFYEPGKMPEKIVEYCKRSNQKVPKTDGEIIRVIMEGLAMKYRYCLEQLEDLVERKFDALYIIGGGSKDSLLCELTAGCCNRPVYAGPSEATALGNAMAQFISLGAVADVDEARKLIRQNYPPIIYFPVEASGWEQYFTNFVNVVEKSGQ